MLCVALLLAAVHGVVHFVVFPSLGPLESLKSSGRGKENDSKRDDDDDDPMAVRNPRSGIILMEPLIIERHATGRIEQIYCLARPTSASL